MNRKKAELKDYRRLLTRTMAQSDLIKFSASSERAKPYAMLREKRMALRKTSPLMLKLRVLPPCQ
jgi:hypothetical protein